MNAENHENPTPDHTTEPADWALLELQKQRAERLLEQLEALQNALARAKRFHEAARDDEVDHARLAERTQQWLGQVERDLATFPGKRRTTVPIVDQTAREVGETYWQHIERRRTSTPTGLAGLNEMLSGGLEPQRLLVLLGAPGGGKTTLANQIAVAVSDAGQPVLYVTSEDQPFTLLAKTISRRGDIKYTAVLKGYESERARIDQAIAAYSQTQSADRLRYLDASSHFDLSTIEEHAGAHFERCRDGGQGLLIIDYLQRLARAWNFSRGGSADLRQAVTQLTEQLRALAVRLDCTVIALASQNRASGYGAANNALASAKESGDIEYTADVLMALGEDTDRISTCTWLAARILRIDKNRQGETGILQLDWYADRQQFTEYRTEDGQELTNTVAVAGQNGSGRRGGRR